MNTTYNIYCDESCHLEHDRQKVMVLGAVWCPTAKVQEMGTRIKEIKLEHGFPEDFEIKWTKVSPAKIRFYLRIMDYFFDDDDLHFRALVAPDKSKLKHDVFGQTHDDWYYKMYFQMLKAVLDPKSKYRIYLDIKDTRGGVKVQKLHAVLSNSLYDFSQSIIERIQIVRSHESHLLQLTDLLIGAISYANRGLAENAGKNALVHRMKVRSGYDLTRTTLLREEKVNLFAWTGREPE